MAELRPKIVKLCKVVGGLTGLVNKIDENAPEYYCLAGVLTDDEADVAIAAGLRQTRTAEYLASKVGRSVEETQKIAEHLAWIGVFRITRDPGDGKDRFFMQIFAPGIMEMMVNNRTLLNSHPEIGRAFEEYTRIRMAAMSPMLPNGYGLMRVVPVENAIKDIPGVSDYDRLSYYLNKYDVFSVSECSCRASRTTLGDGCIELIHLFKILCDIFFNMQKFLSQSLLIIGIRFTVYRAKFGPVNRKKFSLIEIHLQTDCYKGLKYAP